MHFEQRRKFHLKNFEIKKFFRPVFYSRYFENIFIEFTVSSSDSSDDVIASSLDSILMSRVIFAKGKVSTCYIGIELKMVKQS